MHKYMLLIVVIIVTVLMTTGVPEFHKQEVESDDDAEGYPKQVERGGGHFSDGEQNRQTWEDRNIRLRINANRAKKGANPIWSTTDPAYWDVYGNNRWSQWPAEWEAEKTKQLAKTTLETPSPVDDQILDMWDEGGFDSIIDEGMDEEMGWDGSGMEKEADAFVFRGHDPLYDPSAVLNMGGMGGGKWKGKKMRYLNTHYRSASFPPYTYDSHGNFVNAPKIKSTSGLNAKQIDWYNKPQKNKPTRESLKRQAKDAEMNYREPPDIE